MPLRLVRLGHGVGEAGHDGLAEGAVAGDRRVELVGAEHRVGMGVELSTEQVGDRHTARSG